MGVQPSPKGGQIDVAVEAEKKRQAQVAAEAAAKEAERVKAEAARGYDAQGRPLDPKFNSLIDATSGLLDPKYRLNGGADVTADQRAIEAIRQRGLSQGPSEWARAALDKQGLEQSSAMDQSRQQSAGAQAQTLASLMMRGGLSSGSRERLAGRSMRDQALSAQNVFRQGQTDRANIGMQDEQLKTDALKTTAGFDFQNANLGLQNRQYSTDVQKANLQAALNELQKNREFDMDKYKSKMQEWGAAKTADAQRAASGGGKK